MKVTLDRGTEEMEGRIEMFNLATELQKTNLAGEPSVCVV